MAGPLTIACPTCGEVFSLPAELVDVDTTANRVVLSVDRSAVYGHLTACAAKAAETAADKAVAVVEPTVPRDELAGRIERFLTMRAYVATGGSRACTMCGVNGEACMDSLAAKGPQSPCCPSCGDGNTHPAPRADMGCAEWATEHGAKS